MDVQKQVDYWRNGSEEDIEAARSLLEKKHVRHSLFFAHLALEKMLKALVTRETCNVPPRIHNLVRLAEIAGLRLTPEQVDFLRKFNVYQLEGRYPQALPALPDLKTARLRLSQAKDMQQWLKTQL